jgi:hypothetical protein
LTTTGDFSACKSMWTLILHSTINTLRVSHFEAFSCRCFILKKGRLDKFESRSSDGVLLAYASDFWAFHVHILDTNLVMETCEVTFDETAMQFVSLWVCRWQQSWQEDPWRWGGWWWWWWNSNHACTLYFHYDDYDARWSIPYTAYDLARSRESSCWGGGYLQECGTKARSSWSSTLKNHRWHNERTT